MPYAYKKYIRVVFMYFLCVWGKALNVTKFNCLYIKKKKFTYVKNICHIKKIYDCQMLSIWPPHVMIKREVHIYMTYMSPYIHIKKNDFFIFYYYIFMWYI